VLNPAPLSPERDKSCASSTGRHAAFLVAGLLADRFHLTMGRTEYILVILPKPNEEREPEDQTEDELQAEVGEIAESETKPEEKPKASNSRFRKDLRRKERAARICRHNPGLVHGRVSGAGYVRQTISNFIVKSGGKRIHF
jgi:hypothetical protein